MKIARNGVLIAFCVTVVVPLMIVTIAYDWFLLVFVLKFDS